MRYRLAASLVLLYKRPKAGEPHEWTPIASRLLEKAPDSRPVLSEMIRRLYPTSYSGSLSTNLEGRLELLNNLPGADAPALAELMAQARQELKMSIDAARRSEQREDRSHNNRFE